jgi:hypothetical protein
MEIAVRFGGFDRSKPFATKCPRYLPICDDPLASCLGCSSRGIRASALADKMGDAIKAGFALMGATVKAVDDRGRDLLVRTGQRFGQADRLERERRV